MHADNGQSQEKREVCIPDTYRNPLSCGFDVIEEMLADMTAAIAQVDDSGGTGLSVGLSVESQAIQSQIKHVRDQMDEIRAVLRLNTRHDSIGSTILSRCTKIWEVLCDLKTDRLGGYGDATPDLPDYLDPKIDDMLKTVDNILVSAKTLPRK